MAIGSISGVTPPAPQVNTNAVKPRKDSDGDHDNSKAGEVEKAAAQPANISSSSTVGSLINTKA